MLKIVNIPAVQSLVKQISTLKKWTHVTKMMLKLKFLLLRKDSNVEAEGCFEAVVHSEDFLKLNQAKVTFCDMWMKN